ncbi:hypothetical protein [Sphingopyxis fribergensis]
MTIDDGKPVPIQQVVDDLAFTAFHARILALVAGVILLDGFDIQLAAFAAPAILADWQIGSARSHPSWPPRCWAWRWGRASAAASATATDGARR